MVVISCGPAGRPPAAWWLASMLRVRRWSEAVDIDRGQLVRRRLKDVAVVMELHEFAPVGRRAAGRRKRRRLERFAEVGQNLPDRPWFGDETGPS
jgi:hypothetical protein